MESGGRGSLRPSVSCGCVLGALLLGGCTAALPDDPAPARALYERIGPMVRVTPAGMDADEFNVAVDPGDPLHVAVGVVGSTCNAFESWDGGASWDDVTPPFSPGNLDPWVTIDRTGRLHMACIEDGMRYTQRDNGSWSQPIVPPGSGTDKPTVFAASDGTLYYCSSGRMLVSRDDGTTWQPSPWEEFHAGCDEILETREGAIVATYHRMDALPQVPVGAFVSRDAGGNWTRTAEVGMTSHLGHNPACDVLKQTHPQVYALCVVATIVTVDGVPADPAFPDWSIDPVTGEWRVVFQSLSESSAVSGYYQIEGYRSEDEGASWSPMALPPGIACDGCHAFRPTMAGGSDQLVLRWKEGTNVGENQQWLAESLNGGGTWSEPVLFDTQPVRPGTIYDAGGDYWYMEATGLGALVLWIDQDASSQWLAGLTVEAP